MWMTMRDTYTDEARKYFRRADGYRFLGKPDYAKGCELKALRKLEKSYSLGQWWEVRGHPFPSEKMCG